MQSIPGLRLATMPPNGNEVEADLPSEGEEDEYGNPFLHEDTLILLISLGFMILLGMS